MTSANDSFLQRHSLSLAAGGVVVTCLALYIGANPATHAGAFWGNAIADWAGVLTTVLATKHLAERRVRAALPPGTPWGKRARRFAHNHSLTLFLGLTGVGWVMVYLQLSPESRWGQVVGSVVSEWTQSLGLVLMSKRFFERNKVRER